MLEYYTIGIIAFLAAASPGPDFIVTAKHAISYSRYNGVMVAFGISIGILVHTSYCILGLAVVISHSLILFNTIKYLGASYLIYLGIKSLLAKKSQIAMNPHTKNNRSGWHAFRDGLLTNLLNPKCTLFMLSLFTLIIDPNTSRWVQASYGLEIAIISIIWFSFLSYGLTTQWVKARLEKAQHIVTKLIGGVLIALGLAVIFEATK